MHGVDNTSHSDRHDVLLAPSPPHIPANDIHAAAVGEDNAYNVELAEQLELKKVNYVSELEIILNVETRL